MKKTTEDAPTVWGSDEFPVKGRLYTFVKPIKAKSSLVKKNWRSKEGVERKFLTGRFNGEIDGKLEFIGPKIIGEQKDPKDPKKGIFHKKNGRSYSFLLPKDFKVA